MNNDEGRIGFSIELDDTKLRRQISNSQRAFEQLANNVEADGARMDDAIGGIGNTLASLGAAWSLQEFARKVASVRGEFQKLEVAMETMLGSKSKAEALMAQMVQTAATTPFGLNDVANGAKQLLAYGVAAEDVNETLIRLGDIAAGLSIPLNDLVYLYGTTMSQGRLYTQDLNQFMGRGIPIAGELAKQFGVAEGKVRSLVEAGEIGFENVKAAIESLTNDGGRFGGLMEAQSKTISGQIANIEDAFDMMFNEIGQNSEGVINSALSATSTLVENYETVAEALGTLVATYGVYKASLMALTAYTNAAYSYEITQLKAVVAEKGMEIDADLQSAVSKGTMTSARAQEVQALRMELAAKIENAKAAAIETAAEARSAATKRMSAQLAWQKAKAEVQAKQEEIFAMEGLNAHQTVETLYKEKDILVTKMHAAQERLDAAVKVENAAKTNAATAAQNVNTLTTKRDTIAKKTNGAATTLLTLCTNSLTKALQALKSAWATNPAGVILMGLTLVAGAVMTATDAFESAEDTISGASQKFGESIDKVTRSVDTLFAVIDNTRKDSKVHKDAIDELCKIYEEYGIKIDDERDKLEQLNEQRQEVIRLIREEGEERRNANLIASYDDAIEARMEKMRTGIIEAFKGAEWEGTGYFNDWDANDFQKKAEEATKIVNAMIESEIGDIRKLSAEYDGLIDNSDRQEAVWELSSKISKALEDIGLKGLELTDINLSEYIRAAADDTENLANARDKLADSMRNNSDAANDEAAAVDVTTLSFDDLYKAAYDADEQITTTTINMQILGNTNATPLVQTSSIDNAINQTNTLINNLLYLNGQVMNSGNGVLGLNYQLPKLNLGSGLGLGGNKPMLGFSTSSFTNTGNSEATKAQNEMEKRMIAAMKTRKGVNDMLKEVNASLQNAVYGSADEKRLLAMQSRLNAQKKKFDRSNKKTEGAAERAAKIQNAELEVQKVIDDNREARERAQKDYEYEQEQNSIQLELDAAARKRRQLELDHKKEQDKLQQQHDAAIKAELQRQKKYFDAVENAKAARNNNYVKKSFTDTDIDQSELDKIKSQYGVLFKQLREQQTREQTELMQVELGSMRDYLKEYGSFEQQKLAITEEYNQRIKKAETVGDRLRLKKEKEKALSSITFENISMGIDWHALLSGIGSLSHEMMKPLLEQLETYTQTDEYVKADIQEREKVVELIQEIRQYIGTDKEAGWEDLATAIRDFSASVVNYKELEKQEKTAITARENAKRQLQRGEITQDDFEKIDATANDLGKKTADARDEMQELGKTLNEISEKVRNYVSPLTASLSKLVTWEGVDGFNSIKSGVASLDNLKGALDSVLPSMGDGMGKTIGTSLSSTLGSTLGSIGGSVTSILSSGIGSVIGIVAQIPKLILDLVSAIKNMVTGVLDAITDIISLRWIDDIITSVLDAIGNLVNAIFDLPENLYKVVENIAVNGVGGLLNTVLGRVGNVISFGFLSSDGPAEWFNNSNAKEVQDTINRLTERNEMLQTSIEDLTDTMKQSKGTKSVEAYRQAYEYQKETNENYLNIAKAQAGYSNNHHSWNYYWGGFSQAQIDKFSGQIGREWDGSLWSLSPEEMKLLRSNVDMWTQIQNTGKGGYGSRLTEKLDDYIDQAGKLEELTDGLYEGLTGISFDSMYDSFIDTLMDMDASAADAADKMSEYFMRAMLSNKIGELYSEKLEEWWKKFGKAMEDNELTEAERNALQNEYMQYVDEALKLRDELAAATGYDTTSSSQDSTKKGFATASQDSVDELNGRFTAVQMDTSAIRELVVLVNADVAALRMSAGDIKQHTDEIRNLSLLAIDHLETISKNTFELFEINERLCKIEKNTRNL